MLRCRSSPRRSGAGRLAAQRHQPELRRQCRIPPDDRQSRPRGHRRVLLAARAHRAPHQAGPVPERHGAARKPRREPAGDVHLPVAHGARGRQPRDVHTDAQSARAPGHGVERRRLSGRHVARRRWIAAHVGRSRGNRSVQRRAGLQSDGRFAVWAAHRSHPHRAARLAAPGIHVHAGRLGRPREHQRALRRGGPPQSYAHGMSQYGFRDLNLVTTPAFTLANEGNRPVYVPADSIVVATGALSSTDSRLYAQFGQVLVIGSDLQSDTKQMTLGFGGFTGRGMSFQLSYTYTRARDQSSFSTGASSQGFAAASTAGDPNAREWATSSFERRHSFLGTLTYPITAALEVTAIGRLTSGVPFTPLVGSDVNGDGARNDRALVFDPATSADTAVANGMRALLATASPGVRICLQSQVGRVAARNSCAGPWQPSLDLQVNWRPGYFGLDRRLTVSLLTVNLLGGLDEWLHGAANLHGWGFTAAPDAVLLYVRGFDPAGPQYRYAVNGRFRATAAHV